MNQRHDNLAARELHLAWWKRTNQRPVIGIYAPLPVPFGGLDIEVPPDQIAERALRNAEAMAIFRDDKLRVVTINFATAFVPAVAGAGFEYDQHTSWSVPIASCAADLKIQPFDPAHPLFEQYLRRLEPLLENWSWETYLPGHLDYLGPLDVISGMLGPETLAFEMMDNPDDVRARALEAAEFLREMLDYELRLFRQAGFEDGLTDGFATWMPGRGVRFSEDATALVGEALYRECFLEADTAWVAGLDSAFLHMHSGALATLPGILDVHNLNAIELGNDPNGPPMETLVAAVQQMQAAGKSVQLSNWERDLTEAELDLIFQTLSPAGLCITLQARSLEQARELYRRYATDYSQP